MTTANTGSSPTFVRGSQEAYLDLTVIKEGQEMNIGNWQVEDEETMSDHRYITFTVEEEGVRREEKEERRWATKKADREMFKREMAKCVIEEGVGIEEATDKLYRAIREASIKAIPRTRGRARRVYWWTEEIRKIRMETIQARRRASRRRSDGQDDQDLEERYKTKREELKREIQRSKNRAWKRLCQEVEQDPWGLPFRVVVAKLQKDTPAPGAYVQGRVEAVIERLFPREDGDREIGGPRRHMTPEVQMKEVLEAAGRLPGKKAPGPDGYPNELIRMVVEDNPEAVRKVADLSLREGIPQRWKTAKLVLLWKRGKPREQANSYRPVCLLDGLAKMVEGTTKEKVTLLNGGVRRTECLQQHPAPDGNRGGEGKATELVGGGSGGLPHREKG